MKPGKQGKELVDSLENLSTKQQLHDDPNTAYRMPCPLGSKPFKSNCVRSNSLVTAELDPSASKALTQLRNKLLKAGGRK